MSEDVIRRIQDILSLCFAECCLRPDGFNVSSVAYGGDAGVYTILTTSSGAIVAQVAIPEDEDTRWDGQVAVRNGTIGLCVPIFRAYDAIQECKDSMSLQDTKKKE